MPPSSAPGPLGPRARALALSDPGKFANTKGFEGRAQAEAEIAESLERAKGTDFE